MNNITAVVSALSDEVRPITSRMTFDVRVHKRPILIQKGRYGLTPVVFVRSGIGQTLMTNACNELIETMSPDFAIHVGYCGACDPRLLVGDIVIADFVSDEASKLKLDCDAVLAGKAVQICKGEGLRCLSGGIVTVNKVIAHPHEKAFIGTSHSALALDMESFAFAKCMSSANIPFVIARCVLDTVDTELPDLGDAIDEEGDVDKFAFAEKMVCKPKDAIQFPKIGYLASQARQSIATFLDKILSKEIK